MFLCNSWWPWKVSSLTLWKLVDSKPFHSLKRLPMGCNVSPDRVKMAPQSASCPSSGLGGRLNVRKVISGHDYFTASVATQVLLLFIILSCNFRWSCRSWCKILGSGVTWFVLLVKILVVLVRTIPMQVDGAPFNLGCWGFFGPLHTGEWVLLWLGCHQVEPPAPFAGCRRFGCSSPYLPLAGASENLGCWFRER